MKTCPKKLFITYLFKNFVYFLEVKNNKLKDILIAICLIFIGCGEKDPINFSQLKIVDDYYSLLSNDKPYTGPIFNISGKSEGYLKKGKFEGSFKFFYDNDQIKIDSNYKNGILEGSYKSYYDTGVTQKDLNYINGKPNGSYKHYYDNGKLLLDGFFVEGEFDGELKYSFYNGLPALTLNFVNGNLDGLFKRYFTDSPETLAEEGSLYFNFNDFTAFKEFYGDQILNQIINSKKALIDNPIAIVSMLGSSNDFEYALEVGSNYYKNFNFFKLYNGNRKVYNIEGKLIFEANYNSLNQLDGKIKYFVFEQNEEIFNNVKKNGLRKNAYRYKDFFEAPGVPYSLKKDNTSAYVEFTYQNGEPWEGTVLFRKGRSWGQNSLGEFLKQNTPWFKDAFEFITFKDGKPQGYSVFWKNSHNMEFFLYEEGEKVLEIVSYTSGKWSGRYFKDGSFERSETFDSYGCPAPKFYVNEKGDTEYSLFVLFEEDYESQNCVPGLKIDLKNYEIVLDNSKKESESEKIRRIYGF